MKMWKHEILESFVVEELQRIAADKLGTAVVEIPDQDGRHVRAVQQVLQNLRVRRKKWIDAFNADAITAQLGDQLGMIAEEQIY